MATLVDVYAVVPSLSSLFVTSFGSRPLRGLLENEVRRLAKKSAQPIIDVAVGWHLKIAVLTGFLLFFPSWFSAFREHLLVGAAGAVVPLFIGSFWLVAPVLMTPLDRFNSE